jgi:hypothetical protein
VTRLGENSTPSHTDVFVNNAKIWTCSHLVIFSKSSTPGYSICPYALSYFSSYFSLLGEQGNSSVSSFKPAWPDEFLKK